MGIRVEWVRYGREAAEQLRAVIAATKADEPLAPVTVVVPSNHVGVATRRLLASGELGSVCGRGVGLAAVTFLTPYRLAELLGAARLAGAGRRPVSTPVLAAAVRRALRADPGIFADVAEHPATESALVAAYRELRDLESSTRRALARSGNRAGEVVRLTAAARRDLEDGWYDEEDLMAAATDAAREGGAVVDELGTLVVHLPQRLSLHAAALLAELTTHNDVCVVAGTTGVTRADAEVETSVARLGLEASPGARTPASVVVDADRTRIVTTSDADDEVRTAVRRVVDAARGGTPLDRIALLHATPEPYARLLHEHLDAAGIAVNGAAVTPVAGRVAGRVLLGLLALPEGDFRRQDVFAWLTTAPVLHERRWAPVAAWERLSREAAVVAGRDQWDRLLARLAEGLEAEAGAAARDQEVPEWRAERDRGRAEDARRLRAFVLGLFDELSGASAPRPWSEHARWARRVLDRLLGGVERRTAWPRSEQVAAERVDLALDRLAALDAVEGPVPLDVFTRTLELELDSDLGRTGRLGEGVLVGSIGMGIGLDLDLVVVLGLAEGSFPGPVRDDALLPDHERAAAGGQLSLRQERTDREHRQLLGALAGAAHQVLTLPRGDLRRSSERVPSRWVLEIASHLAGERWWSEDLLGTTTPWLRHVPSFDAGLRALPFPATTQEHRLRVLLASGGDARAGAADPVLAAGAEMLAARRSARFTRFDGNLAGLTVGSPTDGVTSPTRLQRWAKCPFDYFLQDVLAVRQVENPEDELQITPLTRGSLVHECLEAFILAVLEMGDRPAAPWSQEERELLLELAGTVCDRYEAHGLTGRPLFWNRDRRAILDDLDRFLERDGEHLADTRSQPIAAELAFGFAGSELGPVPLRLADGRSVRFRGKVDRIDRAADGTLHVVDYKTGSAGDFDKLSEENPDERGLLLQLPVYGEAARAFAGDPAAPAVASYFFVSAKGGFARPGYPVTPEVLERVATTLATIVHGIERGTFPQHPTAETTALWVDCHSCDPDGLGVADLRRAWDRKRRDPVAALYADLAEPLEPEEEDGG